MVNNLDTIVVSSRIRLARNLENYVFPNKLLKTDANEVIAEIFDVLDKNENYKIKDLSQTVLLSLKEKHLISDMLVNRADKGALSLSHDEQVCIMINEEEHIREQCILKGLNLSEALDRLNEVDDLLLEKLPIAYSSEYGFLTACPTNLGTGMRASVMLFLPALIISNSFDGITQVLSKIGLTVRGNYGEGSESEGFVIQVSNSQTLGLDEQQIISNVETAVLKICEKEELARQELLETNYDQLKDKVLRCYGILKYAYKIDEHEAIKLLSQLKFGVSLGLIENLNIESIDKLLEDVHENCLKLIMDNENLNLNIFRASYISKNI